MRKTRIAALLLAVILIAASPAAAYGGGLNGWAYDAIEFTAEKMTKEIKIALIDTGVSTKRLNPELVEPGKNYVFEGSNTEDLNGHGTRVASLILGCADEKGSLPPLAGNVRIIPLVYYSHYASGVPKNGGVGAICAAIYDAVDLYGCRVINISSGVAAPDDRLAAAVKYAEEHDIIVVSAVGNDNIRSPGKKYYPAAYDTVVGVGAANEKLEPSAFSQQNDGMIIYAPGENLSVVSIKNSRVFETVSGTSYATAFVCALAANMLARYPGMTPEQFRSALTNSCAADGKTAIVSFRNAFDFYEKTIQNQKEEKKHE
ncbi:MAG: S8 family serine peptidase [Oscillospiraceae bacterium]|nr:S8 family serine peptidase [Oscillospiraceae bacterium]